VAEHIELTLPARTEFFYLARLHVGAVASRLDMTLEDAEDLHLATEELCMALLSLATQVPDRLTVSVNWDADAIEVRCHLTPAAHAGVAVANEGFPELLSQRILDALVDEHGIGTTTDRPEAWLRKRRERHVPGS
jgi:hypothetical protein